MSVTEPLADMLHRHCNVNAFTKDWPEGMRREVFNSDNKEREKLVRLQLSEAILHATITPEEYERLTGEDFDTQEDLKEWLGTLWNKLYGDRSLKIDI